MATRLTALICAAALILSACGGGEDNSAYLAALDDADLNEWATEVAAVNWAKNRCAALDQGEPAVGEPVDAIAVEFFCPAYSDAFKVLETRTFTGAFELDDWRAYLGLDWGSPCSGTGGYSDLNASTAVVITDTAGDVLTRTSLGQGSTISLSEKFALEGITSDLLPESERVSQLCRWSFEFELTEGSDSYVIEVGDRGSLTFTWAELVSNERSSRAFEASLGS